MAHNTATGNIPSIDRPSLNCSLSYSADHMLKLRDDAIMESCFAHSASQVTLLMKTALISHIKHKSAVAVVPGVAARNSSVTACSLQKEEKMLL